MKKKMMLWLGAALMAGALAGACGKSKPAPTTPPANTGTMGGDAYGAPMGGDAYGNPCGDMGGNPCGNPCGANPCGG